MQKLKQKLFIALTTLLILNPVVVIAQSTATTVDVPEYKNVQQSVSSFLCTPSEPSDGRDLERCVNKLYRFGIAFGAIALVFFVVYAGYLYITGGEAGKGNAKGVLQNSLVGMGLLLGSYVLLRFINPNLVVFKPIQPPIFIAEDLPTCEALGLGVNCNLASATPGADFSIDNKFTGSYVACGKTFSNPNIEKNNIERVPVKVWDIDSGGAKFSKDLTLQMNKCISERTKKAFSEYYLAPDKFPIKEMGGYGIRNIAGTTRISAHAFGLTIDINHVTNCHADNNGTCKSKDWTYKPCPGANCSPYSITTSSGLYTALKANGFGWGGQWNSSKDYMHFSCVENEQGKC